MGDPVGSGCMVWGYPPYIQEVGEDPGHSNTDSCSTSIYSTPDL